MSSPTTSLVAVSKADVLLAADAMIKDVAERRQCERLKIIEVVERTHRVKTGWFKSRPITRDEAIKMVDEAIRSDSFDFVTSWLTSWRITATGNERLANNLRDAVRLSQDGLIYLNLDEAAIVASFLPSS